MRSLLRSTGHHPCGVHPSRTHQETRGMYRHRDEARSEINFVPIYVWKKGDVDMLFGSDMYNWWGGWGEGGMVKERESLWWEGGSWLRRFCTSRQRNSKDQRPNTRKQFLTTHFVCVFLFLFLKGGFVDLLSFVSKKQHQEVKTPTLICCSVLYKILNNYLRAF